MFLGDSRFCVSLMALFYISCRVSCGAGAGRLLASSCSLMGAAASQQALPRGVKLFQAPHQVALRPLPTLLHRKAVGLLLCLIRLTSLHLAVSFKRRRTLHSELRSAYCGETYSSVLQIYASLAPKYVLLCMTKHEPFCRRGSIASAIAPDQSGRRKRSCAFCRAFVRATPSYRLNECAPQLML